MCWAARAEFFLENVCKNANGRSFERPFGKEKTEGKTLQEKLINPRG
jgi:hypothetical protein